MTLAQRIRQARRRAKLSQQALANLLGVQRSSVSNWESTSTVRPTSANLIGIAEATCTSVEWLAVERGSMQIGHDAMMETPALDAELVDLPYERELLRLFRALPNRSQTILMELCEELVASRRAKSSRKAT